MYVPKVTGQITLLLVYVPKVTGMRRGKKNGTHCRIGNAHTVELATARKRSVS